MNLNGVLSSFGVCNGVLFVDVVCKMCARIIHNGKISYDGMSVVECIQNVLLPQNGCKN